MIKQLCKINQYFQKSLIGLRRLLFQSFGREIRILGEELLCTILNFRHNLYEIDLLQIESQCITCIVQNSQFHRRINGNL